MIGRIKGILLIKSATQVLLDVNGLAYELEVPLSTMFQLPLVGQEITLHTHLVIREDAHLLFGFYELQERELFRTLIKVNGVGPKMALAILSGLSAGELIGCVQNNDINTLVRLPGVGRKTAERLLIELRDKLKDWQSNETNASTPVVRIAGPSASDSIQEAEAALISLGYKPQEASRIVVQAAAQLEQEELAVNSETLIRRALKKATS